MSTKLTKWTKRRQRLHDRAMAGVRGKERKRLERAASLMDVGGFVTDGALGVHTVRLLAWPNSDARVVAVTGDGKHRQPRTAGGIKRCISQMLWAKMK